MEPWSALFPCSIVPLVQGAVRNSIMEPVRKAASIPKMEHYGMPSFVIIEVKKRAGIGDIGEVG